MPPSRSMASWTGEPGAPIRYWSAQPDRPSRLTAQGPGALDRVSDRVCRLGQGQGGHGQAEDEDHGPGQYQAQGQAPDHRGILPDRDGDGDNAQAEHTDAQVDSQQGHPGQAVPPQHERKLPVDLAQPLPAASVDAAVIQELTRWSGQALDAL